MSKHESEAGPARMTFSFLLCWENRAQMKIPSAAGRGRSVSDECKERGADGAGSKRHLEEHGMHLPQKGVLVLRKITYIKDYNRPFG
jgi:hypothetical protein